MGPRAAVRVNWPAEQILKLVEAISLDESAIQTYFPKSSTQAIGKLKQSKKFCSKFFKDDPYMLEMERLGYVYRNSIEDEWNIEKWLTVDTHDPIYEKALALKKNFDKLTKDHGIKDKWRSFEDIKKREKRVELQKAIPYYFILKQLCQPNETHITPQPLIIPDYQSSSFSQPRKRKQRSLSIISILSSDSDTKQDISKLLERFQSDTPISPVRAPTSKRVRRAVPTSSPDIEEEIREATTPLRELSISIEHRGYIYQDEQIEIPDIHNGHVQDLDQQPEANLNPDSNSESDSDDASNRLSISPSSSSPSSTCSQSNADTDSSESIHLYTPQLGSFPRPSKTRRSVINNTVPNPASALPDGPGRMDDDAIEMEDETVDGTNANTACTHDELRSGIATLGDPQRPLIASFDDPHPAHSPSANKDNEIDPIDPHATVEEVEIYLKTKSALDPAKLQRATEGFLSRANKSGGKALKVFKADLRKWVQQTQPKNYQKRITNRGRMEMGLEIIRRRLQTTYANGF
ncbi:uncharacterized protein L201_006164 [Kwoniella dendrophila CBS 6074]|uniref:Clr5 domain-containing protein n=1 Tax=Kwoniella dendrophila CBS 6074 TaxID=1295534 RepID=A0AAX4K0Z6_9TREE